MFDSAWRLASSKTSKTFKFKYTKDHKSNQRILRDIAGFVTLVWGFVLFGFVCVADLVADILADCDSCLLSAATSHTKVLKGY